MVECLHGVNNAIGSITSTGRGQKEKKRRRKANAEMVKERVLGQYSNTRKTSETMLKEHVGAEKYSRK